MADYRPAEEVSAEAATCHALFDQRACCLALAPAKSVQHKQHPHIHHPGLIIACSSMRALLTCVIDCSACLCAGQTWEAAKA